MCNATHTSVLFCCCIITALQILPGKVHYTSLRCGVVLLYHYTTVNYVTVINDLRNVSHHIPLRRLCMRMRPVLLYLYIHTTWCTLCTLPGRVAVTVQHLYIMPGPGFNLLRIGYIVILIVVS